MTKQHDESHETFVMALFGGDLCLSLDFIRLIMTKIMEEDDGNQSWA